jgi:2,3-bisphosphoglycerate-independent phosphoglycerate mutase
MKRPLALVILDGWGLNEDLKGNAFKKANTPNIDKFLNDYPTTRLNASGEYVGLPAGQMGNSEVGHLNIGAGRIVYQDYTRIGRSIENNDFFENKVLQSIMKNVLQQDKAVHLLGLLSDGGVHSHINHLFALLDLAKRLGLKKIYIHCILDGRDVLPRSAIKYIKQLENKLKELQIGEIATVSGRYYTMDRDKRWERTEEAYNAMTLGEGETACSAEEAVENSYSKDISDEFVKPTVIISENKPIGTIKHGDGIIFYNFRADRARQITHAFVDNDFKGFKRKNGKLDTSFACMTEYESNINAPTAFLQQRLDNTLGEVLAKNNLKQLRIAETEKYAHVTFFFNGGVEKENEGEDRILIPSPKIATYDLQPEMSAEEVTNNVIEQINNNIYDVIILNYANPDMVGHTGDFAATVKALEAIDKCVKKVIDEILKTGGAAIITSDHGNCEKMIDENNKILTCHTCSKVPFILVGLENNTLYQEGSLRDIAPTMLDILNLEKPKEMTGKTLIIK